MHRVMVRLMMPMMRVPWVMRRVMVRLVMPMVTLL